MSQPRNGERLAGLAVDAAPHERPRLDPPRQPAITPEEMAKVTRWCKANPAIADRWRATLIADPKLRQAVIG